MVAHSDSALPHHPVAEPPPKFSDNLIEWGKIRNLPPDAAAAASPPPKTPWSMVAIRNHQDHGNDTPPIIFPPINHENLQLSPDTPPISSQIPHIHTDNQQISFSDSDSDSDSDSNSSSTFSPSDSSPVLLSPLFSPERPAAATARWCDSWIEILRSKVNVFVRFVCGSFTSSRGVFLTFRSAAFAAALIAFLYFRRRRRLRVGGESKDRLIGIIKQRDEKINQLLDQISRMNQMLLALHKVPTTPKP
ncbi:hypothetical protein BUALT_Bualt07G0066400 [Buddleja alternifolia]|uniref:Uncharacterized protein n=1 Tax=Buddleja alternifolia TaxID=168488 RepID=A0AAV6XJC3_9LAMI|nr:hypothetical protein BUALT_Bualt07G0066400 [Buddleja alternifolia]